MTSVTVFLAPTGVADGVLAVLTDLSAAGLVDPFLWVRDPSDTTPPQVLTQVVAGRSTEVTWQQIITSVRIDVLRVCVVVPLLGVDTPLRVTQERYVADLMSASSGGARTIRIRVLLARPGQLASGGAQIAVDGWHNLVVAPEDRRGPGFGHVQLPAESAPAQIGRYAAPTIAAVTGLWSGLAHAPLDNAQVLPGATVRLTRSFYRKLETDQAESLVRQALLSQDGTLPLPVDARSPAVYVSDVPMATTGMADAFWRKHSSVLRGPRRNYEVAPSATKIGLGTALSMFFGFVWAAIKNAPAAWVAAVVDSVSSGVAATANRAIFGGSNSAYEVVVNGRTARGERADWSDIGSASHQLGSLLAGQPDSGQHVARVDLSTVWQDYARAALTLADAGARSPELAPVQIGVNRGVVARAADVVPGPTERFRDIPGVVAASVEVDSLDATDPLGTNRLRNHLTELERDPDTGLQARETLNALESWQRRHTNSFGTAVGRTLGNAFAGVYGEVQQLLHKLRTAGELPPPPEGRTTNVARWIQVALVIMILVTAAGIYVAIKDILSWWWVTAIIATVYVVCLTLCVRAFIKSQQELFALLNKHRAVLDERRVDEENLRTALRDLHRLAHAYGEYLAWSRALGAFLAAPLGRDQYRSDESMRVSWGLPLSTAVGYAAPADNDVATTVDYLRRDLFQLGWLSRAWERLVLAAAPTGRVGNDVAVDASPLWIQPGTGSGSVLDGWSTALFSGSVGATGADVTWKQALRTLTGSMAQLVGTLVNRVDQPGAGTMSPAEFLSQIDGPPAPRGADSFDPALLTDIGVTNGAAVVADDIRARMSDGVGIICASTQFSDGIPVDYLRVQGVPEAPQWTGVVPQGFGHEASVQGSDSAGPNYSAPESDSGWKF